MSSKQWYYKSWIWGLISGVAYNVIINGPHIGCCHNVPSVAMGALTLGVPSAVIAGGLGMLWKRFAPKYLKPIYTTRMDRIVSIIPPAAIGIGSMLLFINMYEWYSQYSFRKQYRDIDLNRIKLVSNS